MNVFSLNIMILLVSPKEETFIVNLAYNIYNLFMHSPYLEKTQEQPDLDKNDVRESGQIHEYTYLYEDAQIKQLCFKFHILSDGHNNRMRDKWRKKRMRRMKKKRRKMRAKAK